MAAAPPLASPQVLPTSPPPPTPPNTLGAEPRLGAGASEATGREGAEPLVWQLSVCGWLGFGPSSQEAHLALPSLPRPVRSPELCFGPQLFSYPAERGPREAGVGGHRSWIGSDAVRLKWGGAPQTYFSMLVGPHASTPCMNHWETCKASGEISWDLEPETHRRPSGPPWAFSAGLSRVTAAARR